VTVKKNALTNILSPNKQTKNQKRTMSETVEKKRYIVENHLSFSDESGGFAFPCSNDKIFTTADGEEITWSGMTLRDYFAGQALIHLEVEVPKSCCERKQLANNIASFSYELADAMIAKRKEDI